MKEIISELERVKVIIESGNLDFEISRKYKDDQEWWVLGKAIHILEQSKLTHPKFAVKSTPPNPDFLSYTDNGDRFKPIEIGEVLTPNRKRAKEYIEAKNKIWQKEDEKGYLINQIDNPWISFKALLRDKFLKRYDSDCWLIVYHNMSYNEIAMYGWWHSTLIANAKLWNNDNSLESVNLNNSPYEKILVINSSGKAMVSLFPHLEVIMPEEN